MAKKTKEQIKAISEAMIDSLNTYYENVDVYTAANDAAAAIVAATAQAEGVQAIVAVVQNHARIYADIATNTPTEAAIAAAAAATAIADATLAAAVANGIAAMPDRTIAAAVVRVAVVNAAAVDVNNFKSHLDRVLAEITEEEDRISLARQLGLFIHPDKFANPQGAFARYVVSTLGSDNPFTPFTIMHEHLSHGKEVEVEAPLLSPEERALQNNLYQIYLKLNNILLESQRYNSSFSFPLQVLRGAVFITTVVMMALPGLVGLTKLLVEIVKALTEALVNLLTDGIFYRDLALFVQERALERDPFDSFLSEARWSQIIESLITEDESPLLLPAFGEGPEYIQAVDASSPGSAQLLINQKILQGPLYWREIYKAIYTAANVPVAPEDHNLISSVIRVGKAILALLLTTAIIIPSELIVRLVTGVLNSIILPALILTKVAAIAILNIPLYVEDLFLSVENYLFNTRSDPNAIPRQNESSQRLALGWTSPAEELNDRSRPGSGLRFFAEPSPVQQDRLLREDEPLATPPKQR